MNLSGLLESRIGIERLLGADPSGVFDEVSGALVTAGAIAPDQRESIRQAFMDRERQGTTAFGFSMAIPHVFHPSLSKIHLVVARHPTGLNFGAIDGQPTKILICLVGPEEQRENYLKLLSQVARTVRNRDWRRFILQSTNTAAIFDILLEASPG